MVNNNSQKVTSYVVFTLALLSLAVIIAFTSREIFSAMRTANEIDETILQSATPRINKDLLEKTFKSVTEKKSPGLD